MEYGRVSSSIEYSRERVNSVDFNDSVGVLGFCKRKGSLISISFLD